MTNYETIVGLEIHVELKTKSKMFCGCKNDPFHAEKPNIYTCPVCLGLPGALPVANKKAVEWTIMLGLALNCEIPLFSKFDRKNYFYPDLAKGYQISQYDQPFCRNGYLEINTPVILASEVASDATKVRSGSGTDSDSGQARMTKKIRINRVHLEEDTGKLMHATVNNERVSLVDFNRSGVPLIEIVTEADIRSAEEAKIFLKKLHQIIRYLGVSDADMEKGTMRVEPNISVRPLGHKEFLPYKVEVKNINSFKFVSKAIEYETNRHIRILEEGETPKQQTMGWDEKKNVTLPQRSKEEAHDYRYFPDPDLPPMRWTKVYVEGLSKQIPELPETRLARFHEAYGLPVQDAERLVEEKEKANFFEKSLQLTANSSQHKNINAKMIANWILNKNIDVDKISPEELLKQITAAKTVVQVDEKEITEIIERILKTNEKAVSDYKSGKQGAIMFLLGQVMKEAKVKLDTIKVKEKLLFFINNHGN